MKRILGSVGMLAFVGAVVLGATGAFFTDTETSTGNTFTAGAIDLKIDSEQHYNGNICTLGDWDTDSQTPESYTWQGNSSYPVPGTDCTGSWALKDLVGEKFFNFLDLKPGDFGENTISIHIENNEAWACMDFTNLVEADNGQNEPESEDDINGDTSGEIVETLKFFSWRDDGDNIYENGEVAITDSPVLFTDLDNNSITIADSTTAGGPILPNTTSYVGVAWCMGDMTVVGNTISCDGTDVNNASQTDSMSFDVAFEVVQSRNNETFVCRSGGLGCSDKTDIMFVLDSSGSIDSTELTTMKNAAKAFAVALAPSTNGNHIGVVDFDSDATLEQTLTEVIASIDLAIDNLASGGTTAMGDGIVVASTELTSERDRDDASVPDFMIIMTDGQPNGGVDTATAAAAAKAAGTTIYVVGIGNGVDSTFLEGIATSPSHYFTSAEFSDLETVLASLSSCNIQ